MDTPGQVLRAYRQKKGLSTEEFAKKLGVAESTLRSLENGTRPITPERAVDIEDRIGDLRRHQILPTFFPAPSHRRAA